MRAKTTPQRSKRKKAKDPSDAGRYLADVADGHAKPDQYGRGRYDLGRGSAHVSCRQIFLRRGGVFRFADPLLWNVDAHFGPNPDFPSKPTDIPLKT
jgi:hypothetical protein